MCSSDLEKTGARIEVFLLRELNEELRLCLILQYQKVLFHGEELQKRFHETFGAGEDWEKLPL